MMGVKTQPGDTVLMRICSCAFSKAKLFEMPAKPCFADPKQTVHQKHTQSVVTAV